jgi:hypothetical protein
MYFWIVVNLFYKGLEEGGTFERQLRHQLYEDVTNEVA